MPFTLLNAGLLLGLIAVAVPPIIHLLNRRRFDVVRWGAMQFLDVNRRARRRVLFDELLLMVLRMALIALLVLALAAPSDRSGWFSWFADRGQRDVVLVFDGSASMGLAGRNGTAHDAAQRWAVGLLDQLAAGDAVAVLHAKQQVVERVAPLSQDFDTVRGAVETLAAPRGSADWPEALQAAWRLLAGSTKARREVVVLTDGQRHGWADEATLLRWELAASARPTADPPRVWVVNLDPERPADPPRWSLLPLRASRTVASVGQQLRLQSAVERRGTGDPAPPPRVSQELDGRPSGDVAISTAAPEKGRLPFVVRPRFTAPGSHLVSLRIDGGELPGADRQDYALEVLPVLPVLLIDGDPDPAAQRRGADFLRDALSPARDPSPSVRTRTVSVAQFEPSLLTTDLAGPNTAPRVVVLANVARLTMAQEAAIDRFVAEGGGLLVAPGDRADARQYTDAFYRGGRGWLPVALGEVAGDSSNGGRAVQPLAASFFHPALELFRESAAGGLADSRFPRYWSLKPDAGDHAVAVARLTGDTAFFVERPYRLGRVIISAVPLDNSWQTNLIELPAFAPLAHELVFYLAGARASTMNVPPGQPLRYRLPKEAPAAGWNVHPPEGDAAALTAADGQLVFAATDDPGVYRFVNDTTGTTRYFVVQPDPRESDLTPSTDADRERVQKLLPSLTYASGVDQLTEGLLHTPQATELWWLAMLAVIALLAVEVWLTRRRAQALER